MSLKNLQERLAFWQQCLNLGHWTIRLHRGNKAQMQGCVGKNIYTPEEEISDIYLARGAGEDTLIHELLHLVFDGDRDSDGSQDRYSTMHERALNRVSRAYMELSNRVSELENKLKDLAPPEN